MEPRDAIREARLRLRKLAAKAEATAEKLREEKARFEKQLMRLETEHAAWSSQGRPEAQEAAPLLDELRARLAAIELELGAAVRQREEAERESKELAALGPELERAEVQRITGSVIEPASDERSPEDIALENVRHHLDQLEAEASLGAVPALEPKLDPRAQLEALKAARNRAEPKPAAEDPSPEAPPKPKRTM